MNGHSRAGKKIQKVVKLSENAKRSSPPDRAARFTRRLPAHRDRLHPRFTLLLIRARNFEPTTGEFTSQDPLEYVDGMSLYRAYFVPGGVDPSGLSWSELSVDPIEDHFRVEVGATPTTGMFPGADQFWGTGLWFNIGGATKAAAEAKCKKRCRSYSMEGKYIFEATGETYQVEHVVKSATPPYWGRPRIIEGKYGLLFMAKHWWAIWAQEIQDYTLHTSDLTEYNCECCGVPFIGDIQYNVATPAKFPPPLKLPWVRWPRLHWRANTLY